MARFPEEIRVTSRIQAGGNVAQASAPVLQGPRYIGPPKLQARIADVPFYNTPIDKVGSVIRPEALQRFGEVLLDVTTALADRKARLIADKKADEYYDTLQLFLHNQQDGYMLNRGLAAVEAYPGLAGKVNEAEKEILDSVSGHVKLYLNSRVLGITNRALSEASAYSTSQYKVAQDNATKNRLLRIQDELSKTVYKDPRELNKILDEDLKNVYFRTDLDRAVAKDTLIGTALKRQMQQVVVPGEKISESELLKRLDSFQQRTKQWSKFVTADQAIVNDNLIVELNQDVQQEILRKNLQEQRELEARRDANEELLYSAFYQNLNYPTRAVQSMLDAGDLTNKTAVAMRRLFEERDNKEKPINFSSYVDIFDSIASGDPKDIWRAQINDAIADGNIDITTAKELTRKGNSMADKSFNAALRDLKNAGKTWILTGKGMLGGLIPKDDREKIMFSQYVREVSDQLSTLKDLGQLSKTNIDIVYNNAEMKYGITKQLELLPLLEEPRPFNKGGSIYSKPTTLEEIHRSAQYVYDLSKLGFIDAERLQLFLEDMQPYDALIKRFNMLKNQNVRLKKIAEKQTGNVINVYEPQEVQDREKAFDALSNPFDPTGGQQTLEQKNAQQKSVQ